MTRLILLFTLMIGACSLAHEGAPLSEAARARCHDLAAQLRHAAADYDAYAHVDQPSLDQQRRAAIDLPYGLAPKERGIAAIALHDDLQFCVSIRSAAATRLDPFRERITIVSGRLRSHDEAAEIANSVGALAKIAQELEDLPLRE